MKCLRSVYRFSTKIVKLDIDSILSGGMNKPKEMNPNNMLLFYYPISKKHFEENSESLEDSIEAKCENICDVDCIESAEHVNEHRLISCKTSHFNHSQNSKGKFGKKRRTLFKK